MKKALLFLSIAFVAFTGVLFACGGNKYADLSVSIVSITDQNGNAVSYSESEGAYILNYGDEITISCRAQCSSSISKALVFKSYNESALQKMSATSTSIKLKAAVPSRTATSTDEAIYKINVASIESSNGNINLYFKVKLPTTSISLNGGLGITYGSEQGVDLNSNVRFSSSLIDDATRESLHYQVDDTGVSFRLLTFTPYGSTSGSTLSLGENGVYKIDGQTHQWLSFCVR